MPRTFALALQRNGWDVDAAFDAFCRDRDEVDPKGWAHPNPTKTRPPNRALLAVLARIPGCEPLNRRLCKLWPKTVEQLSAVMERNFEEDPSRSLESTIPERTRWQRIRDRVLPPHAPPILEFPKDLLTSMFGEPFFDPAAVPASKAALADGPPLQPMVQPTQHL